MQYSTRQCVAVSPEARRTLEPACV